MKTLNPILVLAGATAKVGNSMFANELLSADRGHRDCKAMRKQSKKYVGLEDVSVAWVTETKVQCSALK